MHLLRLILHPQNDDPRMKRLGILLLIACSFSAFSQNQSTTKRIQSLLLNSNENLVAEDVANISITDDYMTAHNGMRHVYFRQMFNDIEIYNSNSSVHFQGKNALIVHNDFFEGLNDQPKMIGSWMSPNDAFVKAMEILELPYEEFANDLRFALSENSFTASNEGLSSEPIVLTKYYVIKDELLVPVWNVSIYTFSKAHWWNIRIHAVSGEYVEKNDWVTSCTFERSGVHDHDNLETEAGPSVLESHSAHSSTATQATATYNALPLRVESPNHGNRTMLTDPDDSLASPFGWHDINGVAGAEYTITRGNNVYARDDKDANNSGGTSPDGGSSLEFDHPFDKSKSATLYLDAAITNLFVWNNFMHDVWYHYGFDEASGNFQRNNYGRGGATARANDHVNADAQDGSGTNNANFATPPDGSSGRMQMFLWGAASASNLMRVNSPQNISGKYNALQAGFGAKLSTVPITKEVVLVDDGSANPSEGCNSLTNGSSVRGKIALIDRGNCLFVNKVKNAEDEGAVAVIMVNNVNGNPITMGGNDPGINIPSIMISRADGNKIKDALKTGSVSVSLYDSSLSGTTWLDSDFDNGVIAHEFGHGISIRLAGGPSNSGCLSSTEQMGEGWSDFFALVMTHRIGAQGSDTRGVGTYLRGQSTNGRGIRPYPYSTNMTTNPVTYDDIKAGTFTVPHGVGSVWCAMLWDMYWAFIDEYGFDQDFYEGTGGNNIAMQLVIDGLKVMKCSPGFVDGRDAILEADKINNGGKNHALIWKVFARRGLGYSASQGSSGSKTDGTEAFDIPPFVEGLSFSKTTVAEAKATDTLTYTIAVKNITDSTINNITVNDTLTDDLDFIDLTSGQTHTENGGIIAVTIPQIAKSDSSVITIRTKLKSTDDFTETMFTDDMEQDTGFWQSQTDQGSGGFLRVTSTKRSGDRSWYISDPAASSDRSLIGEFDLAQGDPSLSFWHWYNTEADWDGAVIEIDGGSGWEDAGHLMIYNGYNSIISVNPASNISGREAFSGNSGGFIQTIIDLGSYQGKTVKVRFRMVSDGAQGGVGWYIDDVTLYDGLVRVSNTANVEAQGIKPLEATAITTIFEGEKVSIADLEKLNLRVFPNPTTGKVFIMNPDHQDGSLELSTLAGKTISVTELKDAENVINLENLPAGTYLLKVNVDNKFETIRLIKTKN